MIQLSQFCIEALKQCRLAPVPCKRFNPGVIDALRKAGLVDVLMLPSPYIKSHGKPIGHMQATIAGLHALAEARRS